jgi:membrane protein DedA with SNARE-associated domain
VRLRHFIVRFGKWFGVKETDLDRAEQWFDERAIAAVLVGRCVPLIRSIVSIPAGFRRMNVVSFTLYTALGSFVWNLGLIGAGAILGDQWDVVEGYLGVLQWIVVAIIIAAVARYALVLVRRRLSR